MTYRTNADIRFRETSTGGLAHEGEYSLTPNPANPYTLPAGSRVEIVRDFSPTTGTAFVALSAHEVAQAMGGGSMNAHVASHHHLVIPAALVVRADGTPAADDLSPGAADLARRQPVRWREGFEGGKSTGAELVTPSTLAQVEGMARAILAGVGPVTGEWLADPANMQAGIMALRNLFDGVAPYTPGTAAELLGAITDDLRDGYGDMMDENPDCIPCHVLASARRLAIMAATVEPGAVVIDRHHLARLEYGAESYLEDLESGLADGTYEDEDGENTARVVAINAALQHAKARNPDVPGSPAPYSLADRCIVRGGVKLARLTIVADADGARTVQPSEFDAFTRDIVAALNASPL